MVHVLRGPEWEWFSPKARETFFQSVFEITKEGNRMGTRLSGPALPLAEPREMISAAVDHGVIQVPPSGRPIVLGIDRQTIGGYPRIGIVATVDLGNFARVTRCVFTKSKPTKLTSYCFAANGTLRSLVLASVSHHDRISADRFELRFG